ncbi:MAG: DUF302 domain-containing protein [Desulfonatronovibrionaceae bacterium]
METGIYAAETDKKMDDFLDALRKEAEKAGFVMHNEENMYMADTLGRHGVELPDDFDLHMIQICKPKKAGPSLHSNPERATLMPKFVNTFTRDGKVQIRMLIYGTEMVKELVNDADFPESLSTSYKALMDIIERARK